MPRQRKYDSCSESEHSDRHGSPCSSDDKRRKRSPKRSPKRRSPKSDSENSSLSTKQKILNQVKCADKQINKRIDHLKERDYELERKFRLKYKLYKNKLMREKCLFVNGSDAYGSFWSSGVQTIAPGANIIFEKNYNVLNIEHKEGSSELKIKRNGIYKFNVTCQFNEPAQITLFVNGVPDRTTTTASNSGSHMVTMHQILALKKCDVITVRNFTSTVPITTALPASGLEAPSQNIDFTMWRIAPHPKDCCRPPYPKGYDSSSSSDSDSDSEYKCKKNWK
jgi:hypothetical protein